MTIKEVSKKLGLTNDTLRYYEKAGLIGPITKTKSGIRSYNEIDLNRLMFIKCMRDAEVPIEVLKKYLKLYDEGENTIEERKKLLETQKLIIEEKIEKMNEAHKKLIIKLQMLSERKLDIKLEQE